MSPVVLFFTILAAVQVSSEDVKGCPFKNLIDSCCVKEYPKLFEPEVIKECHNAQSKTGDKCEKDMCIARKVNLVTEEDSIDKDALLRFIEEGFKTDTDLVSAIKKKCFEEDISNIGKPEMCEVTKYKICMTSRMAENCPEWNNKGSCSGAQQRAEGFIKMMS